MTAAPTAVYASPAPAASGSQRGSVYAATRYESRFADVIDTASADVDLSPKAGIVPYAGFNAEYDTRSGVPGIGEIYNDDYIAAALGLRLPLGTERYAYAFARAGYSFGLRSQASFPETRVGFDYWRDYGSSAEPAAHAQVTANVTAYSRYAGNILGSIEAFYDVRLTPGLRGMAGEVVAADSYREYGNNYVETYAGFMLPLSGSDDLRILGVEGSYLSRGVDAPRPASYSGLRVLFAHSSAF